MRNIEPIKCNLLGRALVKPYVEDLNDGVIIMDTKELPQDSDRGIVVSVSEKLKDVLFEGDHIIFQRFKPRMFELEGEVHLFVTDDLIHAKIVKVDSQAV